MKFSNGKRIMDIMNKVVIENNSAVFVTVNVEKTYLTLLDGTAEFFLFKDLVIDCLSFS
jgi:hypothetical protein